MLHRKAEARGKGGKFSAPLVLWLPLSETYDPQLHIISSHNSRCSSLGLGSPTSNRDVEYIVAEDAPIWKHVRRMLQPFVAVPAVRQQAPAVQEALEDAAATQCDLQQPMKSADASMAEDLSPGLSAAASPEHISPQPAVGGTSSKAGSEAGENNSTWGSHGSGSIRSVEQDLTGYDLEAEGIAAAADLDSHHLAAGQLDMAAVAADDDWPSEPLVEEVDDGEPDPAAAMVVQEMGLDGGSGAGIVSAGPALIGAGGVPLQPLDIWAGQQQVRCPE